MVTCNKTRYRSRGAADAALRSIRKRGDHHGKKPTRSYLCELCSGWHLTSQPH